MNEKQLCIHISRTSVHVAEVFRSNQEIIWQENLMFSENSPERYKQKLREFFETLSLSEDYEEYSLAFATAQNTLVPMTVFNETTPISIFHFLFGSERDEKTIDFNRLAELNIVCVYEIPDWVKSFFVLKFPRLLFRHELSIALRALFQKGSFSRKVCLLINASHISIFIIHQNELKFSNSYEYQTMDDILYHLTFILEKEGTEESGTLNFYYILEKELELIHNIKSNLNRFQQFTNFKVGEIDSALKLQTLCV